MFSGQFRMDVLSAQQIGSTKEPIFLFEALHSGIRQRVRSSAQRESDASNVDDTFGSDPVRLLFCNLRKIEPRREVGERERVEV